MLATLVPQHVPVLRGHKNSVHILQHIYVIIKTGHKFNIKLQFLTLTSASRCQITAATKNIITTVKLKMKNCLERRKYYQVSMYNVGQFTLEKVEQEDLINTSTTCMFVLLSRGEGREMKAI